GVPIHVRPSFSEKTGTRVTDGEIPAPFRTKTTEEDTVEQPIISADAHDRPEAKLTIVVVPDVPGKAAAIFSLIAEQEINIDMIVQNISTRDPGRTDISFTLPMTDGAKAIESLESRKDDIEFDHIRYDDQIGKLSVVGDGMRSNPGVTATLFRALSAEGVNIDLISTSEIRI